MNFRSLESCGCCTDHVNSNEQREVAVKEFTILLWKIISAAPSIIGVECIYLLARIPALDVFSVILRHIRIATKGEEKVHIFLFDPVCETARLRYEHLSRARTHAALVLPRSLYAKHLEKNYSCLPVACIEHTTMTSANRITYPVPLRPITNEDTVRSIIFVSSFLEGRRFRERVMRYGSPVLTTAERCENGLVLRVHP